LYVATTRQVQRLLYWPKQHSAEAHFVFVVDPRWQVACWALMETSL